MRTMFLAAGLVASCGSPKTPAACEHAPRPEACSSEPRPESGRFDEEVCVPGGWFRMGSDEPLSSLLSARPFGSIGPEHWAQVSPVLFDRYPVTMERYQACVDAGACEALAPADCLPNNCTDAIEASCVPCGDVDPHTPMFWASRFDAEAFCAWDVRDGLPGRLPTEAEYERAVAGLGCEPRTFPWGDEEPTCQRTCMSSYPPDGCRDEGVDDARCGLSACDFGNFCVVSVRPDGDSPDGVSDLLGSIEVPTSDCYAAGFYATEEASTLDPACDADSGDADCVACTTGKHVWRGASYQLEIQETELYPYSHLRWTYSDTEPPHRGGIRCVRDGT